MAKSVDERLAQRVAQVEAALQPSRRTTTEASKVKMGRPSALSRADEWNLYCYRKSGIAIKTCASMFRVSVPTANRIIARFREYDEHAEPLAREFRKSMDELRSGKEVAHG
jgi:hypothetical protein